VKTSAHLSENELPTHWKWLDNLPLPFFKATGQHNKMNVVRIIEALIIAGVAAGVGLFGTVQVMDSRMESLESKVDNVQIQVTKIHDDIYKPVFRHRAK